MENVLIILFAVCALLMIAVILIYNSFDRINFHIERLLLGSFELTDEWMRLSGDVIPEIGDGYFAEKRPRRKMEQLQKAAALIKEPTDAMLELQDELTELSASYNIHAERYDSRLELPVIGWVGTKILRLRPWGKLNFYPGASNHRTAGAEE